MGDGEDGAARKAYEALLRVSLLKPPHLPFHNFSKLVRQKALENYNYSLSEHEEVRSVQNTVCAWYFYFDVCFFLFFDQVNFFAGAFYDGVNLLGMALNETLTKKLNIRDGKAITSLMWNRTFNGKIVLNTTILIADVSRTYTKRNRTFYDS